MPRIKGIAQNTPAWVTSRLGLVTASRVKDVCAKRKDGEEAADREGYKYEIISEIRNGWAVEHLVTKAMQWGIDHQEEGCVEYEVAIGSFTEPGGFWRHDRVRWFGASPDYLIDDDGLVEVKCPFNGARQYEWKDKGEVPKEHIWQIIAQLSVTGRKWCDFVSFDPRAQGRDRVFIKRVERGGKTLLGDTNSLILAVETEVEQFFKEIDQKISKLDGDNHGLHEPSRRLGSDGSEYLTA